MKATNCGKVIFRKWITRGGRRVYAHEYGLNAWPIRVNPNRRKRR